MVVDEYFVNGGLVHAISDGRRIGAIGLHAAAHPDWVVHARENKVFGLDRGQLTVQRETVDRKGVKQSVTRLTSPKWEVEVKFDAEPRPAVPKDLRSPEVRMNSTAFSTPSHEHEATSLIVTADQVIVGGWGKVNIIDISDRKPTWSIEVEGWVRGLAVADSRLYVSTDRGHIYCFDEFGAQPPVVVETSHELPPPVSNSIYAKTVEEIQRHWFSTNRRESQSGKLNPKSSVRC